MPLQQGEVRGYATCGSLASITYFAAMRCTPRATPRCWVPTKRT